MSGQSPTAEVSHALGGLYVVEGAALGRLRTSRLVTRRLGLTDTNGRLLAGASSSCVVARWRAVQSEIKQWTTDETALHEGACSTFARMHDWLCR